MNTAVVIAKIDPRIKEKAQKAAAELGISLSSVINASLREFIERKTVTFRTPEIPSDYLIKSLKESAEDIKMGRVISFKNPKVALKFLDKMIEDDRKSSKN